MINAIFEQLAADSSRNAKIEILKRNSDNELLKQVIFLALDPFTQFYIRKIPKYNPAAANQADTLGSVLPSLEALSTRRVTGNAAIDFLTKLLSSLTADDAAVLEHVIQKDLKCGVSEGTVNAVWKNFIHEYPCMLASAYDQKLVDKVKFPAYVQLKLDGMRFNAIVRNGAVEFRSRNGKEIQIADPTFALPFIQMADGSDVVFDGELLVRDKDGNLLDRKTGNGVLNKAVKGTQSKAEGEMVCATLWDVIPFTDFEAGVCKTSYDLRLEKLNFLIEGTDDRVGVVWTNEVNTLAEAQAHFERFLAQGQEGIILKTKSMIWENKRSKHQIKFKQELEFEAEVIGWEEGTGKYAGMMGALTCRHKDIEFGLGSGFTEEDRKVFTKDYIVGKIITVKYNAIIDDKRTGKKSLFLPIYIEERLDKSSI